MEWISVEKELPDIYVDVLVLEKYRNIKTIYIGYRTGEEEYDWAATGYPLDKVTNWMPLPKPPGE